MTRKENVPYLVDSFANGIFQLTLAKSIDYTRKIYYHKSSNIKLLGSSPHDSGMDYSHPIILDATLIWERTCKYASRAFPENGGVLHGHTSLPYTPPPPRAGGISIPDAQHPLSCLPCLSWISLSSLPQLTNASSPSETDFKGTFSVKEVGWIVPTWCCLSALALRSDRHGFKSGLWRWLILWFGTRPAY